MNCISHNDTNVKSNLFRYWSAGPFETETAAELQLLLLVTGPPSLTFLW